MARPDSEDRRPSQSDVDQGHRIVSQEGLSALADRVTLGMELRRMSKKKFAGKLGSFLQSIYLDPNISAVAFAHRRESLVAPILDVYLLWAEPINLERDASKLRDITTIHAETLERFNPSLNSFLHILDPRKYPSVDAVRREIKDEARSAAYMKLIACASFDRSNPTNN